MSTNFEPTPPSRRDEDFPKTNTIPDGWVSDVLMDVYNNPATMRGERAQGMAGAAGMADADAAMPFNMVPNTGEKPEGGNGRANGKSHSIAPEVGTPLPTSTSAAESESPFARQLDPFPPASQSTGMWL